MSCDNRKLLYISVILSFIFSCKKGCDGCPEALAIKSMQSDPLTISYTYQVEFEVSSSLKCVKSYSCFQHVWKVIVILWAVNIDTLFTHNFCCREMTQSNGHLVGITFSNPFHTLVFSGLGWWYFCCILYYKILLNNLV